MLPANTKTLTNVPIYANITIEEAGEYYVVAVEVDGVLSPVEYSFPSLQEAETFVQDLTVNNEDDIVPGLVETLEDSFSTKFSPNQSLLVRRLTQSIIKQIKETVRNDSTKPSSRYGGNG